MRGRWTTATLVVLLVTAAGGGVAAVARAACEGARPGAEVVTEDLTLCTFNFVFRGSDGRRYIGTAGHCVPDGSNGDSLHGEHKWRKRTGPVATDPNGAVLGHYAFAILKDPRDIALIRLARGVTPNPALCSWGGPTGINADITDQTVQLHFYGNGELFGNLSPARTLTAFGMPDPDEVHADGPISPGDSGSGVISADGRAVGVLVTVGVHDGSAGYGLNGITRLPPQLPIAEKALGIHLRLMKAPLAG
jgi:Trypsin-like peptidase domain